MNIYKKIFVFGLVVFGLSFLAVKSASAADTYFATTTNVTLNSVTYQIASGSEATTLAVSGSSIVVTVPALSTFTLVSPQRYRLDISPTLPSICQSTSSLVTLTGEVSSISITPNPSYACDTSAGSGSTGGGGGGGGGAPASTAPVISLFTASPNSVAAGGAVTLSWSVSNSATLTVNQGVGSLPGTATGTKTVNPTVTTTYTLTATNSAGQSVTATATVTVPGTEPATGSVTAGVHPDGTLVLDGSTVYLIQGGNRYGFRNPDEYKSHGFSFGQLVLISDADKLLPTSDSTIVKALEGTLVIDATDGITVYMIGTGNTKRGFASAEVFKALGYVFGNLPKINLSDYAVGPVIASGIEGHPDGALVSEGQTVWWIRGTFRQGFESMAVFNTYGFSTSKIVKSNAADLSLSEGPLVKFRDGTLVKDGDNYYIISGGKRMQFSSSSDLTSRGYKTSNTISASLSAYESGGSVQ